MKNALLFPLLQKRMGGELIQVNTQQAKKNALLLLKQGAMLLNQQSSFIVATAGTQRRRITLFLSKVNPGALRRSVLIVMGGFFAERIRGDAAYIRALAQYRQILVETKGMVRELQELGLENVSLYPNCRHKPETPFPVLPNENRPLRCLFFSLISQDKGAGRVLEAARKLPHVQFDFFGNLDAEYKETFLTELDRVPNVAYHGVFQVSGDNVYHKINEYDVLLLPTSCPHEGVPGVLVEAKIAAVPAIVSNVCYNAEIIEDGVGGIVLKENSAEDLVKAISAYDEDRMLLKSHKEGARRSAEAYYVDFYLEEIVTLLT